MASLRNLVTHIAAVLVGFTAGCVGPTAGTGSVQPGRPGPTVACLTPHMTGDFGDNIPEWTGTFYIRNNLLIVQHLPTQSEFYVRVFTLTGGSPLPDGRETFVQQVRYAAHGGELFQTNVTIRQHVSPFNQKNGTAHTESFQFLIGTFVGQRFETDVYSRTDKVETTVYATCLKVDAADPRRSLFFAGVAMLPVGVPPAEKQRMLQVLEHFFENVTLYKD